MEEKAIYIIIGIINIIPIIVFVIFPFLRKDRCDSFIFRACLNFKDKNKKVFPLSVKMIIFSYHTLNNYVFNGFRRNTVASY